MKVISKQIIHNWFVSYNPYTDIFQMYDDKSLSIDRGNFKVISLRAASIYADRNNKPHVIVLDNAFEKLGDIENMRKESIIEKVTGYLYHGS